MAAIFEPEYYGYDASENARGEYWMEVGGVQYAFLHQGGNGLAGGDPVTGDFKFHAFKSTDRGSAWTEMDAANAPLVTEEVPGTANIGICCHDTLCRDGNTVYMIEALPHAIDVGDPLAVTFDGVNVWTFDLAGEAWSGPLFHSSPALGPLALGAVPAGRAALQLIRRGAADMMLVYSGPNEIVDGHYYARIYVCPFNGTEFGVAVPVPAAADPMGGDTAPPQIPGLAMFDSGGILHINFVSYGWDRCHVAMSGDTFGEVQVLASGLSEPYASGPDGTADSLSDFVEFDGQIGFVMSIWNEAFPNGQPALFFAPSGVLEPEWQYAPFSPSDRPADQNFSWHTKEFALVAGSDHNLYCFWTACDQDGSGNLLKPNNGRYRYATAPFDNPADWSTDRTLFAHADLDFASYQVLAYLGTTGIGVLGLGYGTDYGLNMNVDVEIAQGAYLPFSTPTPEVSIVDNFAY